MKRIVFGLILFSIFCVSIIVVLSINKIRNEGVSVARVELSKVEFTKSDDVDNAEIKSSFIVKKKEFQILYYYKETTKGLCSGLKQGEKVLTAKHCVYKNIDLKTDSVFVDHYVYSKNVLIRKDVTIESNDRKEFSIATADKGVVSGVVPKEGGCVDDKCLFFKIKSYRPLGQGNSGTPLFDYDGEYAGALSFGEGGYSCDVINFDNESLYVDRDSDRSCSFYVIFSTSENFRKKALQK